MTLKFAFQVLIILIVVSGVVAFVGNYIGRYFGKKRLSIFGLRPRYTAMVFTVFSGILIAILTFISIALISQDARTALFGMKKIQTELVEKSREIEEAKQKAESTRKEIASLLTTKEKLKEAINTASSKAVVFSADEDVFITLIKGGEGKEAAEKILNRILKALDVQVKKYRIEEVDVDKSDYAATVSYVANTSGDIILKLTAIRNVNVGGILEIKFEVQPNQLVFNEGEELAYLDISGKLTLPEIEQKLKDLLELSHFAARNKGVIPDVSGSLGTMSYNQIYETAKRIKGFDALTRVSVVTKKIIYSIGSLDAEFKVKLL